MRGTRKTGAVGIFRQQGRFLGRRRVRFGLVGMTRWLESVELLERLLAPLARKRGKEFWNDVPALSRRTRYSTRTAICIFTSFYKGVYVTTMSVTSKGTFPDSMSW